MSPTYVLMIGLSCAMPAGRLFVIFMVLLDINRARRLIAGRLGRKEGE